MPVAVIGGEEFLAASLVGALRTVSPDVRALVEERDAAERLRALGARVAVSRLTDAATLEVVLRGAHTACVPAALHPTAEEDVVEPIGAAVAESGVRRVVLLSLGPPRPASSNPVLRIAGRLEESLVAAVPCVILCCSLVYGSGSRLLAALSSLARRFPGAAIAPGTQALAPVLADDVARVVAAADDRASVQSGSFALNGPTVVTMDGLADLLDGRHRRRRHVSAGSRRPPVGIPPGWLELLGQDLVAEGPDAAGAFGIALTPLAEGPGGLTGQEGSARPIAPDHAPPRPLER